MIHIHEQQWVILGNYDKIENSDYKLAYMSQREYKSDGVTPSLAFQKRMKTGTKWAVGYNKPGVTPEIIEFNNTPMKGFKILDSVSRWSTQNKLIRVQDPRGFVVEIPTGNLTTLLMYSLVNKSVIKNECVWGKDGTNHILLPVESDVYRNAHTNTETNNSKIGFNKLAVGDIIKFSITSDEYVYMGKGKGTWKVQHKKTPSKLFPSGHQWPKDSDEIMGTEYIGDTKYAFIFVPKNPTKTDAVVLKISSGKCIKIGAIKNLPELGKLSDGFSPIPERLYSELKEPQVQGFSYPDRNGEYYTSDLDSIEMKS